MTDYDCHECGKPVLYRRDHDPACVYYVDPNDPFRGRES